MPLSTSRRLPAALAITATVVTVGCADSPTPPGVDPSCVVTNGSPPAGGQPQHGTTVMSVSGQGNYTARYTAELAVRGTTAYTSTWGTRGTARGNAIMIWDVSGATPQLVDSVIVEPSISTTGDVAVSDDGSLLVVATERAPGHIVVYSLADPRRPVEVSRFTTIGGGGVHTAEIGRVGGILYAVLAANQGPTRPSRVIIVDLSVPASPREVYSKNLSPGFMHDAVLRDGMLFLGRWDQGLAIWDVGGGGRGGSPSNPVPISCIGTVAGAVHNAWWFHDPSTTPTSRRYVFVGEEGPASLFGFSSGDIHVVDISDVHQPREVAFYKVEGAGTHNFWMDEPRGVLYAAYYNGGVRAIDVRGDLGACTAAERSPDGRCDLGLMGRELATGLTGGQAVSIWSVQFEGGFVYASDMLNGLWKLEAVGE
ncbi:MAG: LVIVD repeat-containing protein [Gemmatimonadaceae bacterium]